MNKVHCSVCYIFIDCGRHKTVLMTFDEGILLWVCDKTHITPVLNIHGNSDACCQVIHSHTNPPPSSPNIVRVVALLAAQCALF